MNLDTFDAALASGGDEEFLFRAALARLPRNGAAAKFCRAGAYGEAAMRIHRALLPAWGFQFGVTASGRGLASIWAKGDATARSFEAATAGTALLRATLAALVDHRDAATRAACTLCNGLGWFVTRQGTRRVCRHGA